MCARANAADRLAFGGDFDLAVFDVKSGWRGDLHVGAHTDPELLDRSALPT